MGRSPKKNEAAKTPSVNGGDEKPKSKRASPRKGPSVIKLKVPEARPVESVPSTDDRRPLKLTLKISKSADQVEEPKPQETRITPKLTLSLRRPSVETVAEVPKKRGRKPTLSKSTDSTLLPTKAALSAPVSLAGSKSSSANASAGTLPVVKPAVPVYSEEDRLQRQIIHECLQEKVSRLSSHHTQWNRPVVSSEDLIASLWPFYEQLAVGEATQSLTYRQAGQKQADPKIGEKHQSEYEALIKRFNDVCTTENTRPKMTELVLLEHRLCLEEEKFLYTKLKNDYYTNYANMGAKPSAPR